MSTPADNLTDADAVRIADNAEVLAELDRLQRRQTSGGAGFLLLAVSLAMFVAAGRAIGTWRFVALVVPILLFHELGHFVAMKLFGYRNLRMFFIPFLGAAVSGQNFSAAGWKKVVVALAGPLPGILLGGALGIAGVRLDKPLWTEAAMITLILNAFNLLPVLPLDGGRVAHALFFSRHYLLDVLFRILAALTLLVAWFFTQGWVILVLAAFMAMAIAPAYHLGRIAYDLRREGVTGGSADDGFVPHDAALVILDRLRGSSSHAQSKTLLAEQILSVYETIATRPPGWGVTILLATLHAGAFLIAAIAMMWISLARYHG